MEAAGSQRAEWRMSESSSVEQEARPSLRGYQKSVARERVKRE